MIKFAVVGHHSRRESALLLAQIVGAEVFIDEGNHGANWNHRRAIAWAAMQGCRVVIMEDDAQLTTGFAEEASWWCDRFPDNLISFYLGTSRPPQYQKRITKLIEQAHNRGEDFISLNQLVHGVCYSIPVADVSRVNAIISHQRAADFAIGEAYSGAVIYPVKSIVEHADAGTVEQHPDRQGRTQPRKARFLDGEIMGVFKQ